MLAYKLKKKRDKQTTSQTESQWQRNLEHFEESTNLAVTETPHDMTDHSLGQNNITPKTASAAVGNVDSILRILATHCCTATIAGVAFSMAGVVSSAIAWAYLTGTVATCGFVGLELFRIRTTQ